MHRPPFGTRGPGVVADLVDSAMRLSATGLEVTRCCCDCCSPTGPPKNSDDATAKLSGWRSTGRATNAWAARAEGRRVHPKSICTSLKDLCEL